jgi:hypothetical protein
VQPEALQHLLGVAREQLVVLGARLRRREPHELDLVELVLADEPAHVLAVAARLARKQGVYAVYATGSFARRRGSRRACRLVTGTSAVGIK